MNPLIQAALKEDVGRGDVTTRFFVPKDAKLSGRVVAKQRGVICGTAIARDVFRAIEPKCQVEILVADGRAVLEKTAVMAVSGGPGLLTAERTALNFLQHLSGVATLTRAFVDQVRGTRAKIHDTRKTLPGWRELDKYAVRCGGGHNHRMGLYDAALVKDNHWASGVDMAKAAVAFRREAPGLPLQIEAATIAQVHRALGVKPDIVLLDNMSFDRLTRAIALIRGSAPGVLIEVSGGVTLENVRALAKLGPDRISIGRITHSAPALDLSLEL